MGSFRLIFLFAVLAHFATADLPVHCLHEQIVGKWNFFLGPNNNKRDVQCDNSLAQALFTPVVKLTLDLEDDALATEVQSKQTGFWSMVYDQGFEVVIGGRKFFAFSKYFWPPGVDYSGFEPEHTTSFCDQTMMGWYHDIDGSNWGCYYGTKKDSFSATNELFMSGSSPSSTAVPLPPTESRANFPVSPYAAASIPMSQLPQLAPALSATPPQFSPSRNGNGVFYRSEYYDPTFQAPDGPIGPPNFSSFLYMAGRSRYQPEHRLVAHINRAQASWRATTYREFSGLTMNDMFAMMGGAVGRSHVFPSSLSATNDDGADNLPLHFDWRNKDGVNYVGPVRNQGSCGSCYAFAALGMLEARANILLRLRQPSITLSPQSVVSCNPYSQGCRGGFPYLVSKFGEDFGIQMEQEFPYSAVDDSNNAKCADSVNPSSTARVLRAKDYHYVGGFYGGCSEAAMRQELYQNGPIVGTFDALSDFQHYSSGIYHHIEDTNGLTVNKWEKTTHSVLIVGWGEENGEKYWIIRNSYGPSWGEAGYIRFRRGTDECAMESMALAATPLVNLL